MSALGLSCAKTQGIINRGNPTLKAFAIRRFANAFSVELERLVTSQGCRSSNLGLTLVNAFGVNDDCAKVGPSGTRTS